MDTLRVMACTLLLLATAACQGKPSAQTSLPITAIPPTHTSEPTSTSSVTARPADAGPVPLAPSKAVETRSPPTPSPQSPLKPSPEPITPANAGGLLPIARLQLDPWDQVLAIAWSPGGDSLAVSAGENVYLLSIPDLLEKAELQLGVWAPGLAYAPDGNSLAAADRNGLLRTWDTARGEVILSLQAHQKSASAVAYSPDGRLLASAGYDALARLWDANDGRPLGQMIGGTFAVPAIAFTPDGNSLAIVNGTIIRLRDVQSQRFVKTIASESPLFTIAFSPDGRLLASGDVANTVQVWSMSEQTSPAVEMRASQLTLQGHTGRANSPEALVWQVAFSPDASLLASAGGDATVRIWIVASGELAATLSGHSKAATSVAFSPRGTYIASGGLDGQLILWGISRNN